MTTMQINDRCDTLIITVPVQYKRRSSRKLIISTEGELLNQDKSTPRHIDQPFTNALVKAFTFQDKLDKGVYPSAKVMAQKERLNLSYMHRMMRLTLLAPDIIESLLTGTQPRILIPISKTFNAS